MYISILYSVIYYMYMGARNEKKVDRKRFESIGALVELQGSAG